MVSKTKSYFYSHEKWKLWLLTSLYNLSLLVMRSHLLQWTVRFIAKCYITLQFQPPGCKIPQAAKSPSNPPDHTGLCCQDEARSEGEAAAVYWRQRSRTLQQWEAACAGQGQRSSSKQLLAVVTKELLMTEGHSLLVCGSAPHGVTVCRWKE